MAAVTCRPFLLRPRQFSLRPGKLDFWLTQMEPAKIIEVEIRGLFSTCTSDRCEITRNHREHCPACDEESSAWLKIIGSLSPTGGLASDFLFWGCLSPLPGHLGFGLQQQQRYEGTVDSQRQWPLMSNLGNGDAKMVYGEINFGRDTGSWLKPFHCSMRQLVAALSQASKQLWRQTARQDPDTWADEEARSQVTAQRPAMRALCVRCSRPLKDGEHNFCGRCSGQPDAPGSDATGTLACPHCHRLPGLHSPGTSSLGLVCPFCGY